MTIDDIDVMNKYLVGMLGDKVTIMNPPRGPMRAEDALVLAAYLVALAESDVPFEAILEKVRNT